MLAISLAPVVLAQERLPDRRAVTAPVVRSGVPAGDPALRQNLLDILQQLEELQSELRQLRNAVEVQGHELQQLKTRERELMADLDRRLRELERRGGAVESGSAVPANGSVAAAAAPARAAPPPSQTQQQEYDAAFDLMKQGFYERAVRAFRGFVVKYPDSGLADNAQYWIAEGNYVLRNYKLALEEFSKVLTLYPNSPKVPDAMLKIGYVHYELGAYDKARSTLNDLTARYPNTTVARLATTRLEKMKKEGK